MKAAVITEAGATPVYADFAEPSLAAGMARVEVHASALSHVAKGRASGTHYSSSDQRNFVPGFDGTGTLDDTTAAAIAIPGMSSWAALSERAKLTKGQTVLINGATGASGRLAVQIAKYLGAGKVIATGRNLPALESLLAIGADVTIDLGQTKDALEHAFEAQFREGVAVVLDYLWGPSAESLLATGTRVAPDAVPIRFIQIGAVSASTISLPSSALRSSPIELMGSGLGSVPMPRILDAIKNVFEAAIPGKFEIAVNPVPLSQVASHWTVSDNRARTVFITGA